MSVDPLSVSNLLAVVNGKLYSPRGGSIPPINDYFLRNFLQFQISMSEDEIGTVGLKLLVKASQYITKEDNPLASRVPAYEASLFIPAGGIFNFAYTTPDTARSIDNIFHVRSDKDVSSLRCLTFAASEFSLNMSKVPRLRTPELSIDIARLCNTAKSALLIPKAVLEFSFVICGASGTTDSTISAMETALFNQAPESHIIWSPAKSTSPAISITPTESQSPPLAKPSQPTKNFLNIDQLAEMYNKKNKHVISKSEGVSTPPTLQSPFQPTFDTKHISWSTPLAKLPNAKSENTPSINKVSGNSPPAILIQADVSKHVCFNCYAVGHREMECMHPKRIPKKKGHRATATVSGEFLAGKMGGFNNNGGGSGGSGGAGAGGHKISKKAGSIDLRGRMEKV